MIFLIGVYGYVLYVLLLIGHHAVRHQQLTKQRRLLVNIIAPGMGYYYNNEIRRPALFFSVAVILAGFYLVGIPMWLVPMSMLFLLALCEGYAWREQSLMQQMKRLEACTHKRPIVALDEQAMKHAGKRRQLFKLYEQSTYEFAITKEVVAQLQRQQLRRPLELMFYEGRLRIVDYNTQEILRHFPLQSNFSEELAHFIADSVTQKEVFVMPFRRKLPNFPGIIHLKHDGCIAKQIHD
ncbi:hypothetical protein QI30_17550 [Kurthia sp. 3B1D]|uniref:Uncharacterized protein n=1 Tax=Candidatus Kurthia intestinigallinarum TaxID=1562256 RepID=A0A433RQE8_9BACL|nr:hypothetical protein [Kurthia sp. 3B1D]RUS52560.1 hypothetical protein QI30_17550 [Kurthia sp. 3B1D]